MEPVISEEAGRAVQADGDLASVAQALGDIEGCGQCASFPRLERANNCTAYGAVASHIHTSGESLVRGKIIR